MQMNYQKKNQQTKFLQAGEVIRPYKVKDIKNISALLRQKPQFIQTTHQFQKNYESLQKNKVNQNNLLESQHSIQQALYDNNRYKKTQTEIDSSSIQSQSSQQYLQKTQSKYFQQQMPKVRNNGNSDQQYNIQSHKFFLDMQKSEQKQNIKNESNRASTLDKTRDKEFLLQYDEEFEKKYKQMVEEEQKKQEKILYLKQKKNLSQQAIIIKPTRNDSNVDLLNTKNDKVFNISPENQLSNAKNQSQIYFLNNDIKKKTEQNAIKTFLTSKKSLLEELEAKKQVQMQQQAHYYTKFNQSKKQTKYQKYHLFFIFGELLYQLNYNYTNAYDPQVKSPLSLFTIDWFSLKQQSFNQSGDFLVINLKNFEFSYFQNISLDNFDNESLNNLLNNSIFQDCDLVLFLLFTQKKDEKGQIFTKVLIERFLYRGEQHLFNQALPAEVLNTIKFYYLYLIFYMDLSNKEKAEYQKIEFIKTKIDDYQRQVDDHQSAYLNIQKIKILKEICKKMLYLENSQKRFFHINLAQLFMRDVDAYLRYSDNQNNTEFISFFLKRQENFLAQNLGNRQRFNEQPSIYHSLQTINNKQKLDFLKHIRKEEQPNQDELKNYFKETIKPIKQKHKEQLEKPVKDQNL